jgi:hypothetical protein
MHVGEHHGGWCAVKLLHLIEIWESSARYNLQRPTPSDLLPLARLISLPKLYHQLGAKHSKHEPVEEMSRSVISILGHFSLFLLLSISGSF